MTLKNLPSVQEFIFKNRRAEFQPFFISLHNKVLYHKKNPPVGGFLWRKRRDYSLFVRVAQAQFLPNGKTGGTPVPPIAGSRTHISVGSSPCSCHKKIPLAEDFFMAQAAGLEPTTHSLGNCCSILMSYACVP